VTITIVNVTPHAEGRLKEALINAALVGSGGFAGAVFRYGLSGLEGFGAHSRLHTAKILRLSSELPIVVEIVDTEEKIEAFLPLIDDAIVEGLATVEKVEVLLYRSRNPEGTKS
jgi:PII-like signaling protein